MKWVCRIFILCILVSFLVACGEPPEPIPRDATLGDYSGSARWAYELAEPHFAELLPDDAVLYYIYGFSVGVDGRLAANRGYWDFRFWSESLGMSKGVSVWYDGEVNRSVVSSDVDPTDTRPPIPSGWLNSTEIYDVVCPGCGSSGFGPTTLNLADSSYGNGQSVWILLNLNNQMVRWDGVLVEGP